MQSKAKTVAEYLDSLPADRRATIEAVRKVIRANLDAGYEEGMQYGMIGYYVPHKIFPAGYHCDPKQPLPFGGLASQSGHLSLYLMGLYVNPDRSGETDLSKWFRDAWTKTGKKLDMGKACVRFKKLDDVALDVLGEAIRRMTVKKYIETYTRALGGVRQAKAARKAAASGKRPAASKAAATKSSTKATASRPAAKSAPATKKSAARARR